MYKKSLPKNSREWWSQFIQNCYNKRFNNQLSKSIYEKFHERFPNLKASILRNTTVDILNDLKQEFTEAEVSSDEQMRKSVQFFVRIINQQTRLTREETDSLFISKIADLYNNTNEENLRLFLINTFPFPENKPDIPNVMEYALPVITTINAIITFCLAEFRDYLVQKRDATPIQRAIIDEIDQAVTQNWSFKPKLQRPDVKPPNPNTIPQLMVS